MTVNAEQVVRGLMDYTDNEVMNKLPTTGKWVVGTAVSLVADKATTVIDALRDNNIAHMIGIVDDNGMIDVDAVINAMRQSADKYGKITLDVPLIGRLTFSSSDIDNLRNYIR